MKKMALIGAGKIGRSFIGQLFSAASYEVVFIDINRTVIDALNERHEYQIIIKGESDESITVNNVRGVLSSDKDAVVHELATADIAAVSVGKNALPFVIPNIARGLEARMESGAGPLDIIIAENMLDGAEFMRERLAAALPPSFAVEEWAGLIETSIGKMVPIMPHDEEEKDPLLVFAEQYNTLIVDAKAFKNALPAIPSLAPKNNMKAWVDRKAYIHNFGHAALGFTAYLHDSEMKYVWEALEIEEVRDFTRTSMLESAAILLEKYPDEFTRDELEQHIDDLLYRFGNKALGDTIHRVGCDLRRKLGREDRVAGVLMEGVERAMPVDRILATLVRGYMFRSPDEEGRLLPSDEAFSAELEEKGFKTMLMEVSGIPGDCTALITRAEELYERLRGRSLSCGENLPQGYGFGQTGNIRPELSI